MSVAALVLALVTLQRVGELALARRNTARLLAAGAVEVAPGHYPAVVALHAAWLVGLWVLGRDAAVQPAWLALFCVLQLLRVWVIATLGPRWTTRIVVSPGRPLVAAGPYRWMSHPNYAVVASEIAVLPLALGLFWFALLFTALNGAMLAVRIRAEERALAGAAATAAVPGAPPLPGRP